MDNKLDCCPFLHAVADRIKNVNNVHGDYCKIQDRRDNEQKLVILSNEIKKLMLERRIIHSPNSKEQGNIKISRKLTFFLIVNTQLPFLYDLKEDQYIATCINKCPQITSCVLMHLVWDLNLEEYFYEAIALTPYWMSFTLLDAAKNNIEHLEPFDFISKNQKLIEVTYHQITRLEFLTMDDNERQITLSGFVKSFVQLLKNFISPPSNKMSSWSNKKMMEYVGHCLQCVLEMTLYCINKFLTPPTKKISKSLQIYTIRIKNVPYKNSELPFKEGKYQPALLNTLSLLNNNLFDTCSANVKTITMKIFIYWVEIEEDDSEDNLQYIITKLSYELQELMIQNDFKHDLIGYLQNFAKKPKTLFEKIRDADISTVIRCVNLKNENQKAWFNKLVENDSLFTDTTIRQCLEKYVQLVDSENILIILQKLVDTLTLTRVKIEPDEKECMKQLFLVALKTVRSVESQIRNVQGFLIQQGATKILQTNNFENDLNIVFNKTIVMDNYKLSQMLGLVIQNPEKVYSKTIETCIKNSRQVDLLCSMLQSFKTIGDIRFRALGYEINNRLQSDPLENENLFITALSQTFKNLLIEEHDAKNFTKFISNIKNVVIDVEKLFSKFFMPAIQTAVSCKDCDKLLCLIKGLNIICDDNQISHYYAPTLVMMGQVLEYVRWDLLTFANVKVQIVNIVIEIIQKIGKQFLKSSEDKVIQWLQIKLNSLKPINKMHFNCLWQIQQNRKDIIWAPVLEQKPCDSRQETIAYLCENMSRMVPSELKLLKVDDMDLLCETMKAIASVVSDHKEKESALGLMIHHFKLCAVLFKEQTVFSDFDANVKLFERLLQILKDVPLESRENCCLALINILTGLLNAIVANQISEELEKTLESNILNLDCVQTQGILIKMLRLSKENSSEILNDNLIKQEIEETLRNDISDAKMEL